jgi:phosphomannomutase
LSVSKRVDFDRLFRAYDIRGIYPGQLEDNAAMIIGVGFAKFLGEGGKVVVGRDVRLSGERLRNGLVDGLRPQCDVTDVGIVSTPMVYFATNRLRKNAGIMITASHNPPEWNGFKMFSQKGCIYGEDMEKIKKFCSGSRYRQVGVEAG